MKLGAKLSAAVDQQADTLLDQTLAKGWLEPLNNYLAEITVYSAQFDDRRFDVTTRKNKHDGYAPELTLGKKAFLHYQLPPKSDRPYVLIYGSIEFTVGDNRSVIRAINQLATKVVESCPNELEKITRLSEQAAQSYATSFSPAPTLRSRIENCLGLQ